MTAPHDTDGRIARLERRIAFLDDATAEILSFGQRVAGEILDDDVRSYGSGVDLRRLIARLVAFFESEQARARSEIQQLVDERDLHAFRSAGKAAA